jgi:hypothetical protein
MVPALPRDWPNIVPEKQNKNARRHFIIKAPFIRY